MKCISVVIFIIIVSLLFGGCISRKKINNVFDTYEMETTQDGNIEDGLWANEDKGNDSTACVSLRFFSKDKLGHIIIEVFAELDDGGNFTEHNCCFLVSTEYGLLMSFCESLVCLKNHPVGYEIRLNDN